MEEDDSWIDFYGTVTDEGVEALSNDLVKSGNGGLFYFGPECKILHDSKEPITERTKKGIRSLFSKYARKEITGIECAIIPDEGTTVFHIERDAEGYYDRKKEKKIFDNILDYQWIIGLPAPEPISMDHVIAGVRKGDRSTTNLVFDGKEIPITQDLIKKASVKYEEMLGTSKWKLPKFIANSGKDKKPFLDFFKTMLEYTRIAPPFDTCNGGEVDLTSKRQLMEMFESGSIDKLECANEGTNKMIIERKEDDSFDLSYWGLEYSPSILDGPGISIRDVELGINMMEDGQSWIKFKGIGEPQPLMNVEVLRNIKKSI